MDSPHALPPALSGRLDAGAVFRGLRRHWVLAMTLGAICSGGAAALAWKLMPASEYMARAMLQVHANERGVLVDEIRLSTNEFRTFQKTQETLIKSHRVLNAALDDSKISQLRTIKEHPVEPSTWLAENLKIDFQGEIMNVGLGGNDPRDITLIVNAVVDAYLNNLVNAAGYDRRVESDALREKLLKFQESLKSKREHRKGLAMEAGAGDQDNLKKKLESSLADLNTVNKELWFAKSELRKAEIERDLAMRKATPNIDQATIDRDVEELIARNPDVVAMEDHLTHLEDSVTKAKTTMRNIGRDQAGRETLRQIQQTKKDLEHLRAEVGAKAEASLMAAATGGNSDNAMADIRDRLAFYGTYVTFLESESKRLTKASEGVNQQTTDLSAIDSEIATLEATTQKMAERVHKLEIELGAPLRIELIEHADQPRLPDAKKRLMVTAGAGMGTLALVLLGISFLEYRIRRIDSPESVARGLGMRIVGALPATPNRSRFALPGRQGAALQEAYWRSRLNESVNAIRTLMLRHSQNERLQVVMVTSASVGEGKTSLSCHLATSLARAGRKTLLLDCDLRNPTAHRVFDLPLEPGMCEVLRGQVSLEEISHPIALGDLRMITAGKCDLQALQALGMEQIAEVIARLREQYEFIVVDTPPVLPVADPLLIGQHVDAALFSILRDVSRAPKVHTACERLSTLGIRILGAVVAGTPLETSGSEYYYTAAYVNAGTQSLADDTENY
jgi:capsular exopolysaccharide synthesis family protein